MTQTNMDFLTQIKKKRQTKVQKMKISVTNHKGVVTKKSGKIR